MIRHALAVASVLTATVAIGLSEPGIVQGAGPTSAFQPLASCRLLDTRSNAQPLRAGAAIAIATTGRCNVPAAATALAVSVTATQSTTAGYAVVWPGRAPQPSTSTVNVAANETRANGAIIAVAADGSLSVAASAPMHVVVDVVGAFVPAASATAGRFVAMTPRRLLDTRTDGGRPSPGGSVTIPLPPGVAADATALSITIATADSAGPGYFATHPAGSPRPASSTLNTDGRGQVRATGQIVAVGPNGFTVFSQQGEHLIVDVTGWFTGPSGPSSSDGLFVATTPTRLIDTRVATTLYPDGSIRLDPTSITGGPVAAIAANWTMTRTWRGGYVTVHPAATARPGTATINADGRGQDVAQFGIVSTSTAGVTAYASGGTQLVADITGWFTGTPMDTRDTKPERNIPVVDAAKRVLLMGDSTLAGVRWYTNSQHALSGSTFLLDVESCRRLVVPSCRGREGRAPPTAVHAIQSATGPIDVVVIMTGYNDWYTSFDASFEQIVAASRAKGATAIVWLTYREAAQAERFRPQNEILRAKLASGAYPDVHLADWNAYTASNANWFTSDGIHFTITGAYGAADYISRAVASLSNEPCPAPWAIGGAIETPCSWPDARAGTVDPLALYQGNPNDIHCYEVGADRHIECRVDPKLVH
jgi:hypothetical protein